VPGSGQEEKREMAEGEAGDQGMKKQKHRIDNTNHKPLHTSTQTALMDEDEFGSEYESKPKPLDGLFSEDVAGDLLQSLLSKASDASLLKEESGKGPTCSVVSFSSDSSTDDLSEDDHEDTYDYPEEEILDEEDVEEEQKEKEKEKEGHGPDDDESQEPLSNERGIGGDILLRTTGYRSCGGVWTSRNESRVRDQDQDRDRSTERVRMKEVVEKKGG
jgi:hypothetical protein